MRAIESNSTKSSILDTSLTELAFIFFFILLLVSVWKLNEQESKLTVLNSLNQEQKIINENNKAVSELVENLKKQFGEQNFDEFFTEISKLKERIQRADELEIELIEKQTKLDLIENKLAELVNLEDKQKAIEKIREISQIQELLKEINPNESNVNTALKQILLERNDAMGQNNNLRQQIVKLGNGLVHPPCWADAETGAIEYLYDITIHEENVTFARGWPDSRNTQATADTQITSVIGKYNNNNNHLIKSEPIYNDSIKKGCRHFVRISDKAISKDAFKKHLLAIEKHFYKLLTEVKYGK